MKKMLLNYMMKSKYAGLMHIDGYLFTLVKEQEIQTFMKLICTLERYLKQFEPLTVETSVVSVWICGAGGGRGGHNVPVLLPGDLEGTQHIILAFLFLT